MDEQNPRLIEHMTFEEVYRARCKPTPAFDKMMKLDWFKKVAHLRMNSEARRRKPDVDAVGLEISRLERLVRNWQSNWLFAAEAISKLRPLLAKNKVGRWQVYCRERLGMAPQRAGQLFQGWRVISTLKNAGIAKLPKNEAQCHELRKLKDSMLIEAWERVSKDGVKITAQFIRQVVSGYLPDTPPSARR